MSREHCVGNRNNIIIYKNVKNLVGEEEARKIFEGLPFPPSFGSSVEFRLNGREWETLEEYLLIYEKAHELVPFDKDFYFNCGASVAKFESWDIFSRLIGPFFGPIEAYRHTPKFNKQFNDTKDFALVRKPQKNSETGFVDLTFIIKFHDDIDPVNDYISDPHIRGILSAIPESWGLDSAIVEQPMTEYDVIDLLRKQFNLESRIEGNDLVVKVRGGEKVFGKKVILEPSEDKILNYAGLKDITSMNIDKDRIYLGKYGEFDKATVSEGELIGILTTSELFSEGEKIFSKGQIFNGPYFVINTTSQDLKFPKTLPIVWRYWFTRIFNKGATLKEEYLKVIDQLNKSRAGLYEQLEERTAELQKAHDQLIQSEKRAAIYHLVAGVRHEMNTHIQTLLGNAQDMEYNLVPYIGDILKANSAIYDAFKKGDIEEVKTVLKSLETTKKEMEDDLEGDTLVDKVANSLKGIIKATRVMEGIVKKLKLTSEYEFKPNDLTQIIDDTLLYLSPEIRKRLLGLNIKKDYGEEIPYVECDESTILQALSAQIINSLDAIVTKKYSGMETPEIYFRLRGKGKYVELITGDNGVGIEPDDQRKIFDAFYTKKAPGQKDHHGLGLHEVAVIIQGHGGTHSVQSELGKYTNIIWQLPISQKK